MKVIIVVVFVVVFLRHLSGVIINSPFFFLPILHKCSRPLLSALSRLLRGVSVGWSLISTSTFSRLIRGVGVEKSLIFASALS